MMQNMSSLVALDVVVITTPAPEMMTRLLSYYNSGFSVYIFHVTSCNVSNSIGTTHMVGSEPTVNNVINHEPLLGIQQQHQRQHFSTITGVMLDF